MSDFRCLGCNQYYRDGKKPEQLTGYHKRCLPCVRCNLKLDVCNICCMHTRCMNRQDLRIDHHWYSDTKDREYTCYLCKKIYISKERRTHDLCTRCTPCVKCGLTSKHVEYPLFPSTNLHPLEAKCLQERSIRYFIKISIRTSLPEEIVFLILEYDLFLHDYNIREGINYEETQSKKIETRKKWKQ